MLIFFIAVDVSRPRSGRIRGYSLDTDAVSSLTTCDKQDDGDVDDSSEGRDLGGDDWFRQLASAYRHMRQSSQAISLPPKLECKFWFPIKMNLYFSSLRQDPGFSRSLGSSDDISGKESAGGSYKSTNGSSYNLTQELLSHRSKPRSAHSTSSASRKKSDKASDIPGTEEGSYYNRVVSAPSKEKKSVATSSELTTGEDYDDEEIDGIDEDDDEDAKSGRRTYLVESNSRESRRRSQEAINAVSLLERKHGRSMLEIKTQLIGNLNGMQSFRSFLEGTQGARLYDFWMEAERFKDEYETVADKEDKRRQHNLFRNILDLFGTLLTEDARAELYQLFSDSEFDRSSLVRPQYGALRRLRAYWIPRYILHRERIGLLSQELTMPSRCGGNLCSDNYSVNLSFPALALGSWVCSLHAIGFWSMQCNMSRPQSRMTVKSNYESSVNNVFDMGFGNHESTLRDKLISALMYEQLGGGPLSRWARKEHRQLVGNILGFNRDVTELTTLVSCMRNDRMLRRERYWSIYNKYISPSNAQFSIECPQSVAAKIHAALSLGDSNTFVLKPDVFSDAQLLSIDKVMPHWLDFLKTDSLNALSALCAVNVEKDPLNGPTDRRIQISDVEIVPNDCMFIIKLKKWVRRYFGGTPLGASTPLGSAQLRRNLEDSLWDAAAQAKWKRWLADQRKSASRLRKEDMRAAHERLAAKKREADLENRVKRVSDFLKLSSFFFFFPPILSNSFTEPSIFLKSQLGSDESFIGYHFQKFH